MYFLFAAFRQYKCCIRASCFCCILPDEYITTCFNHELTHFCSFCCLAACPYVSFSSEEPTSEDCFALMQMSAAQLNALASNGALLSNANMLKNASLGYPPSIGVKALNGIPPLSAGALTFSCLTCQCVFIIRSSPGTWQHPLESRWLSPAVFILLQPA